MIKRGREPKRARERARELYTCVKRCNVDKERDRERQITVVLSTGEQESYHHLLLFLVTVVVVVLYNIKIAICALFLNVLKMLFNFLFFLFVAVLF